MTMNRKHRRQDKALTKAIVRIARPKARFMTWNRVRRQYPERAADIAAMAAHAGYSATDLVIYTDGDELSFSFPADGALPVTPHREEQPLAIGEGAIPESAPAPLETTRNESGVVTGDHSLPRISNGFAGSRPGLRNRY